MIIRSLVLLLLLFTSINVADASTIAVGNLEEKNGAINFSLHDTSKSNELITLKSLKTLHTKKIHVLIIDDSFQNFSHVHPYPIRGKDGFYQFKWNTRGNNTYKMWVDLTPLTSDEPIYIQSILKPGSQAALINKDTVLSHTFKDGFKFSLSFDKQPKAGEPLLGRIIVTKNGKQFNKLQPVLGAYVHIAAFGEDFNSFFHTHPMGKEPKKSSDLGSGGVQFHIEGLKPGYIKLFAQFKINNKDIIVPFGFTI